MRLKLGQRFAVSMLVWAAACGVAAGAAQAETDPSFLLTATPEDFAAYFPSYLANGYLSTMTGPRGTEGNLAYVVAFMDYARDDIARPLCAFGIECANLKRPAMGRTATFRSRRFKGVARGWRAVASPARYGRSDGRRSSWKARQ